MHNIGNNVNSGITGFATWKQKIQWQNITFSDMSEERILASHNLWLLGITFCDWMFLFSCGKASDANIGIFANFV